MDDAAKLGMQKLDHMGWGHGPQIASEVAKKPFGLQRSTGADSLARATFKQTNKQKNRPEARTTHDTGHETRVTKWGYWVGGFGQVRAGLNSGRFGTVPTEPRPNLPDPRPNPPWAQQIVDRFGRGYSTCPNLPDAAMRVRHRIVP